MSTESYVKGLRTIAYWVKSLDGASVRFLFYRSSVCTRRVVGTTEVPERVIPSHTKEIVEWEG